MGKTGAKFIIGLGFALIMLSLFFRTWKQGNAASADGDLDAKNAYCAMLKSEPTPPAKPAKVELPDTAALANKLGITKEDFEKNLKDQYDKAKKHVDDAAKDWNKTADNAAKGDWDKMKEWVSDMGDYYADERVELAKNGDYAADIRELTLDKAKKDAKVFTWRWSISYLMFFGVLIVSAGALMLSMSGEGNEKLGGLVLLGFVLFFICMFWGGIGAR